MPNSISDLLEPVSHRQNRLCVKNTATTVHSIARWWRTGMSADEIAEEFPHLTLAGVHAALAFYFANREKLDKEIEKDIAEEKRLLKMHSKTFDKPVKEAA